MRFRPRLFTLAAGALTLTMAATGCAGAGGGLAESGPDSINVLMVNNPQMLDLQKLTAEHFTKQTGIRVNYTAMPENDVRAKIIQEFSWQAGQYDVASLSNYEIPFFAENGWLAPLDDTVATDPEFDQQDILPAYTQSLTGTDGHLYGEPFYGESSLTIYRKDLFAKHGLKMPDNPTWDEVADLAEKIDEAEEDMKGICLRGQPGWGQVFSPLTSVVNTFGGTWFDKNWQPQVNAPEFSEAVTFYTDLVREHGESGAAQAGFAECLNNMVQSNTAMWYDASSAGSILEAKDSPVRGKLGYAQAPVKETKHSGWLWTWSWGIQSASEKQDAAAEFVAWASSKEYEELVAEELGWASVPAGKRKSTYEHPEYQQAAPFFDAEREAILNADPTDPGVQERPYVGIQFAGIPEFADLGTSVSEDVSAVIAGKTSVKEALDKGQKRAERIAQTYRD